LLAHRVIIITLAMTRHKTAAPLSTANNINHTETSLSSLYVAVPQMNHLDLVVLKAKNRCSKPLNDT